MVLWRAKVLALDLRYGRVPERDKLGYLLIGLVIQGLIGSVSRLGTVPSLGEALGTLLVLVISVGGTVAVFRVNARGDGRQFLERFLCLAVPVGVQMYVGYAVLALLVYIFIGGYSVVAGGNTVASWVAWSLLYYGPLVWFYLALRRHVAVAAGVPASPPHA